MAFKLGRRQFLQSSLGATAGLTILPSARMVRGSHANERLNLAVVGMAGYGAMVGFAEGLHNYANVSYAVSCDVDQRKVQRVYDLWAKRAREWTNSDKESERKAAVDVYAPLAAHHPPLFTDFRRMLDEAGSRIDAVVVATPDHSHANISAAALRAGKPVFSEKPLTIAAHEARALHRLSKERQLPTQMNNHGANSPGFRRGLEVIREGLLGEIRDVHVYFSRGGRDFQEAPRGSSPIPPELEWNLWLAQLKWRDYNPDWINRIAWRESSIGELGNFGPHTCNLAFMALNVKDLWEVSPQPARIEITSECSGPNQLSYPKWEKIRWQVPARGALPPVTFTWHHGHPPDYAPGSRETLTGMLRDLGATDAEVKRIMNYAGCLIVGSEGILATASHNTTLDLFPKKKFDHVEQKRPLKLPIGSGHYAEWINACRGGPTPMSNFEYAAPFAEFLNVGSLSTRFPGEAIAFEPATGRITNHPRAAEFLAYPYRDGWTI